MNKDLDERLIPKGEYREAQNIHISESDNSDVGAIENILSNKKLTSAFSGLGTNVSGEGYEVIGYCKDLANKRVVYFISNFSNTSFTDDIRHINRALNAGTTSLSGNAGHDSAIILYDIENNTQNILVKGPWLNLSKNHLITGVAIVEDLLFWTDNLNQPRKINIQTALEEGSDYYDCEENISVAKYAPYKAIMLHDDSASSSSLPNVQSGIESEYMKERFIRFSYRYKYDDGEYSLIAPFTQAVFEPLNGGRITNNDSATNPDDERNTTSNEPNVLTGKKEAYKKGIVDIMQNRINSVDLRIPLPNKDEFTINNRTKIKTGSKTIGIVSTNCTGVTDGTYSVTIDGGAVVSLTVSGGEVTAVNVTSSDSFYYEGRVIIISSSPFNSSNVVLTLRAEDIDIEIANDYGNPYNIKEIEILVKESDGISFKLIKSVKVSEIDKSDIIGYTHKSRSDTSLHRRHAFKYTYKSSEPYQVLTEGQVNRVYDQVPLMAKTLEVVGNRVVFGNYVENYSYPTDIRNKKGINYRVKETTKGLIDQAGTISGSAPYLEGLKQFMHKAYKYHTLKQRRTYQVGIVFSDAFGRQSPVILSSNIDFDNPDTITILPEIQNYGTNTNAVWNTTHNSYGKSLSIEFQDNDLTNDAKFIARLPFGADGSEYQKRLVYNPHGWHSYRIVVKQQEQEYYNVYAPHTFDGWDNVEEQPNNSLTGGRSWLFLHGDNVNKVPRSLNDTDLNRDGTMGSNVRLYPKVIFDTRDGLKLGDITSNITIFPNTSGVAEGDYTVNITDTGVITSGNGDDAQITLTVDSSGVVSAVSVVDSGSGFKEGDTITITSSPFNTNNVVITLGSNSVYNSPGESRQNNSYHELAEVISLGTAFEQNLYISGDDNKSGTGGFSVYNFIYGKNKNPLVAEMQNMRAYTGNTSNNQARAYYLYSVANNTTTIVLGADQLGNASAAPTDFVDDDFNGWSVNMSNIPHNEELKVTDTEGTDANKHQITVSANQDFDDIGDKIILSNYYEGLSVFETEPFISKLDIYYETSTSGLVKDLTEEIVTDVNDLPTGLTIKQDTGYDFGTGQPAVSTSHPQYGTIAYLYENTEADNYIADLDATQSQTSIDAGATKDLTFSIQKATRLGDNANITNDLAVQEVSGVSKVKVVGTFVYRGNAFDDIELLVEVNDNNSGGTAFLTVTIQVANSKPTLDSLPASIEIQKDAGGNSNVIVSNNNFTNGGLVTGGAFNKYSDVDITRSFPGINLRDLITGQLINFEDYFVAEKTSVEGVYEVKTTAEWDVPNAARFFEQSAADRTMTITATDSGGLTTTTSTVINEDDIVTVRGRAYEYTFSDITEDNAWTTATSTGGGIYVWATTGTGLDPVNPYDEHFLENSGYIKLSTGNKLFSKSDLSSTLSAGKYLTIREIVEFGSRYDVDVIQVSSSGVVSILDTFTVLRFPK